jgi:hypothetical protein
MQSRITSIITMILVGAVSITVAGTAFALPTFSRQHKTECSTCHTIFSELNEYGEAFKKNSYVPITNPSESKNSPASPLRKEISGSGDPELLKLLKDQALPADKKEGSAKEGKPTKNEGIWLSGIPEQLPVSFRATQNITFNNNALDGNKADFATRTFALQAGGNFRDDFGFFASYLLGNHIGTGSGNENLRELFLVWRNLLDTPINIKFGRFEPKLSLWKKSDKITTASSFATMTYRAGNSPFTMESPQEGVEANFILWNRLFVAGGIIDRNGQGNKESFGHMSLKIGGSDFHGTEPEIDFEKESIFDNVSIILAGFGYFGRNTINDYSTNIKNEFYRGGGEMDLLMQRLRLKVSGMYAIDENPQYNSIPVENEAGIISTEVEYLLGSPVNAACLFRYEFVNEARGITRRYVPALAYSPHQNMKVALEYIHEEAPAYVTKTTMLGLSFSF